MEGVLDGLMRTEFISVCVGDPKPHRGYFWHSQVDYNICLHTNSMCFRKKTSCVRRRYSEFVWLRQCLQQNALIIDLPKLPPWNPFFSLNNAEQVKQRMKGLQDFLQNVLQTPLLLSDSRLHLFLQSDLCIVKMERCARGDTRYSVAQAIQRSDSGLISRFTLENADKSSCDSDCESSASSGLGLSVDTQVRSSPPPFLESNRDHGLFINFSQSPSEEQNLQP